MQLLQCADQRLALPQCPSVFPKNLLEVQLERFFVSDAVVVFTRCCEAKLKESVC